MAAVEAMAVQKAVVACRTGGLQDVVVHGETGFLVEPGNSGEMAAAIIKLLKNPALAGRMGRAGEQRVQEQFTLEKMTAAFAELYGSLLSNADAKAPERSGKP
jgi:glycosyltransferase involved in cell wall biosynthesis